MRCSCKPELEGVGDGVRASRDGMEIRWGGTYVRAMRWVASWYYSSSFHFIYPIYCTCIWRCYNCSALSIIDPREKPLSLGGGSGTAKHSRVPCPALTGQVPRNPKGGKVGKIICRAWLVGWSGGESTLRSARVFDAACYDSRLSK